MSRPSKLNNNMKEAIIQCIRAGLSYRYTCDYVGISEHTFIDWRRQGEKDYNNNEDSISSQLFQEVKKAESEAILMRLKNIHDASNEHWQAAAWFLERKYPDEFGRKDKHEIGGELKIESFLKQLPPDVAEAVIKLCLSDSDEGPDQESSA